jgi:predicted transcriptional regulator
MQRLKTLLTEKKSKKIDIVLPEDKKIVLQADADDHKRGLIVTWKSSGGYDVQYWYDTPTNIVPAELKGDGESFGDSIKTVHVGYHPELDEE